MSVRSRGSGLAEAFSPGKPSRVAAADIQMGIASGPGIPPLSVFQSAVALPLRKKQMPGVLQTPPTHPLNPLPSEASCWQGLCIPLQCQVRPPPACDRLLSFHTCAGSLQSLRFGPEELELVGLETEMPLPTLPQVARAAFKTWSHTSVEAR